LVVYHIFKNTSRTNLELKITSKISLTLITALLLGLSPCSALYAQEKMKQKDSLKFENKIVPDEIWRETYIALSHYPELKNTPIEF